MTVQSHCASTLTFTGVLSLLGWQFVFGKIQYIITTIIVIIIPVSASGTISANWMLELSVVQTLIHFQSNFFKYPLKKLNRLYLLKIKETSGFGLDTRCSILSRDKIFIYPDWLALNLTYLCTLWTPKGFYPREIMHFPFSVEVMNKRSYTCTRSYVYKA